MDEDQIESCGGVLKAVHKDFLINLGSESQGQLLLYWKGVLDGVAEALEYSLYSEDGLGWKVNEDVLYQLTVLENRLHHGVCRGCFCNRHVCG